MISDIREYALSDAFPLLLMSSRGEVKGGTATARDTQMDPRQIAQFGDPADVPNLIEIKGLTGTMPFDTKGTRPSLAYERMILRWLNDERLPHRVGGPAEVILSGVRRWHREMVLHRDPHLGKQRPAVEVAQVKFNWLQGNRFYRPAGPHEIVIHGLRAFFTHGKLERVEAEHITFEFAKLDGERVGQPLIETFLDKNPEIKIEMWSPDLFFSNPLDEFVFMNDATRELVK